MKRKNFYNFWKEIKNADAKIIFRTEFLNRSGLSYPTFDIYKNIIKCPEKKIPKLPANVIKELAQELHPNLLHLLN